MSRTNGSLILKESAEIEGAPFFPNFDLPEIDKAKPKFHCTGERLFRDRPDVYKAVVQLIAEPGVSVRTICRECHVSDHTVRSVAEREQIPIATVKKQVLSNITHGLRLASERVIELIPEASPRDALIGVGILGEKMQLLGGEALCRIDLNVKFDIGEKMDKLTEALRAARAKRVTGNKVIDGKIIEIGVGAENIESKALANGERDILPVQSVAGDGEAT
ncbi:MAG: hypothetical protein WA183_15955 [Chthoniobacterales bacterium]